MNMQLLICPVKLRPRREVSTFCNAIGKSPEVTLIDCGADVGVFSALVTTRCSNVKRLMAFEPNSGVFEVLRMNLAGSRIGVDPYKHLRYLSSIRKFNFLIAETGQEPDGEQPLLSAAQHEIWNVIASTE